MVQKCKSEQKQCNKVKSSLFCPISQNKRKYSLKIFISFSVYCKILLNNRIENYQLNLLCIIIYNYKKVGCYEY